MVDCSASQSREGIWLPCLLNSTIQMGVCLNLMVKAGTPAALPFLICELGTREAVGSRQFSFKEMMWRLCISLLLIFHLQRLSSSPYAVQGDYDKIFNWVAMCGGR